VVELPATMNMSARAGGGVGSWRVIANLARGAGQRNAGWHLDTDL
jgi:hypothetical protein